MYVAPAGTILAVSAIELPPTHWYDYVAQVEYQHWSGMLKCGSDEKEFEHVKHVVELRLAQKVGERFCTVFTWPGSFSLKEYLRGMSIQKKNDVLPVIFAQVLSALQYLQRVALVHDNINLENIMIRRGPTNVIEIVITDLDLVWSSYKSEDTELFWDVDLRTHIKERECKRGYRPPEEYGKKHTISQSKRSSWMVGATLYAAMTGIPPYGYTSSASGIITWPDNATKQSAFSPVSTMYSSPLRKVLDLLLTPDTFYRPSARFETASGKSIDQQQITH
ncbi:kinase-like domain-containing protein [Thamnocephalis sphaerospora]|uniref:non-specific serine/threonine protein kinase n=1 Tax=Thamnocephalis sphaerospora TaxID=78915 RepID=A0A4P9XRJ5_9FUNG|nr:kinase-like domain-containing protein [Thamnocephalis sphaerospora]|eukprot:RKP08706.1 kinase-like domain-containing protein [Thamnocephalis sphaerospora]